MNRLNRFPVGKNLELLVVVFASVVVEGSAVVVVRAGGFGENRFLVALNSLLLCFMRTLRPCFWLSGSSTEVSSMLGLSVDLAKEVVTSIGIGAVEVVVVPVVVVVATVVVLFL